MQASGGSINYQHRVSMRSSEKGKPDLFDKQLSGTANFRVRDLTLDPGSKVSKEASYVDLLVLAQLEVVQSEGGA